MLDYGIAHHWFPNAKVAQGISTIIKTLTPLVSDPPRPLPPKIKAKVITIIDTALKVLDILYKLHQITPEGYGILKEDLLYIKTDYLK